MQIINKLQCPGCGVTSDFKETVPNKYRCTYCNSNFEHISSIPSKTGEAVFYEQFLKIYDEHFVLTPDLAKYHERMLSGLFQLNEYLKGLEQSDFYGELSQKFEDLVKREIEVFKTEEITVDLKAFKNIENGKGISQFYSLGECYRMLSYHQWKMSDALEELQSALDNVEKAIRIKIRIDGEYSFDLIKIKIDILQKMKKQKEVYEYLYLLNTIPYDAHNGGVEMIADKEKLQYDFESIFLSEEYKKFLATRNT